jgi:hypothetical protein
MTNALGGSAPDALRYFSSDDLTNRGGLALVQSNAVACTTVSIDHRTGQLGEM